MVTENLVQTIEVTQAVAETNHILVETAEDVRSTQLASQISEPEAWWEANEIPFSKLVK